MYGMPGNRFCDAIRVSQLGQVTDLIKEAQVRGKPTRTFFSANRKEMKVSFDGTYLVDTSSGEILDDESLEDSLKKNAFFTNAF